MFHLLRVFYYHDDKGLVVETLGSYVASRKTTLVTSSQGPYLHSKRDWELEEHSEDYCSLYSFESDSILAVSQLETSYSYNPELG